MIMYSILNSIHKVCGILCMTIAHVTLSPNLFVCGKYLYVFFLIFIVFPFSDFIVFITRRKAVGITRPKGQQYLTGWARHLHEETAVVELVDMRLRNNYLGQEVQCMVVRWTRPTFDTSNVSGDASVLSKKKEYKANLFEAVSDDLLTLNKNLQSIVGAENPVLMSAAEQIFSAGGKRMRPALVFLVSRATLELAGLEFEKKSASFAV